jgi:CheY-like chemotaxis protein
MSNDTRLEARRGGLRVLVLDDNHDAAESLGYVLALWGHEPVVAYDTLTGVELARIHRPDVALLDLGLPFINGYEAAELLRNQPESKDVVLIAITGHGSAEARRRCKVYGFRHHLLKPVELDTLQTILKEIASALTGSARPQVGAKITQRIPIIKQSKPGSNAGAS